MPARRPARLGSRFCPPTSGSSRHRTKTEPAAEAARRYFGHERAVGKKAVASRKSAQTETSAIRLPATQSLNRAPVGSDCGSFHSTSPRIRLGTFLLIAGSPADAHGSCQPGVRLAQRTSHRVPEPRRPRPRREVSLARPLQVSPAVSSSALDRRYQIGYYRDAATLDS